MCAILGYSFIQHVRFIFNSTLASKTFLNGIFHTKTKKGKSSLWSTTEERKKGDALKQISLAALPEQRVSTRQSHNTRVEVLETSLSLGKESETLMTSRLRRRTQTAQPSRLYRKRGLLSNSCKTSAGGTANIVDHDLVLGRHSLSPL